MTEVDPEDDTEVDDDVEELVAEPADLEEVDDPDAVVDIDESDDDDDDVVVDDEDKDEDKDKDKGETTPAAEVATDDDDEEEEDEEGDVEASLDVILKERLVQVDEEDDDDEPNDPEDRAAPEAPKVLPKQPKEFVCQSCFLVKHPSQMSDSKRKLCRDCV